MKIKIIGAVLTAIFLIVVAFLLIQIDVGIGVTVPDPGRLLDPSNLESFINGLSNAIWNARGIDVILQAIFLFVAAIAASVFFVDVIRKE